MPRNYKKEYKNYQGTTKQKKRRASRNTARNRALAKGTVKKGDKKDIDHKDGNPFNNTEENLQTLCNCCHNFKRYSKVITLPQGERH